MTRTSQPHHKEDCKYFPHKALIIIIIIIVIIIDSFAELHVERIILGD